MTKYIALGILFIVLAAFAYFAVIDVQPAQAPTSVPVTMKKAS